MFKRALLVSSGRPRSSLSLTACGGKKDEDAEEDDGQGAGSQIRGGSGASASGPARPPAAGGDLTGKVAFAGARLPQMEMIKMDADALLQVRALRARYTQEVVVNPQRHARVGARLRQGRCHGDLPAVRPRPSRSTSGAASTHPHIFGIRPGRTLKIVNSDGTLHNIHALPKINAEFNIGQPFPKMATEKKFDKPEVPVRFKCDVHKWMGAYCGVFNHPFFAITNDQGTFEIKNLPPGNYVIEAWQEKYGTADAERHGGRRRDEDGRLRLQGLAGGRGASCEGHEAARRPDPLSRARRALGARPRACAGGFPSGCTCPRGSRATPADRRDVPADSLDHRRHLRPRRGPARFLPVPLPAQGRAARPLHARQQPARGDLDDRSRRHLRRPRAALPPLWAESSSACPRTPCRSRSRPSSSPGTSATPGPDGKLGTPDDIVTLEPAPLPGRQAGGRDPAVEGRHPFVLPSGVPRQAGRRSRHDHEGLVRRGRTGHWEIACAELCGLGHYRMKGFVTADTRRKISTSGSRSRRPRMTRRLRPRAGAAPRPPTAARAERRCRPPPPGRRRRHAHGQPGGQAELMSTASRRTSARRSRRGSPGPDVLLAQVHLLARPQGHREAVPLLLALHARHRRLAGDGSCAGSWPGRARPIAFMGKLAPEGMPGGQMLPEYYNSLFTMHATIMIFFAIMPILIGAFGELRGAAPDRGARHGLPDAEHGCPSGSAVPARGPDHLVLLRDRRRGAVGLDVLRPALGDPAEGPDAVAARRCSSWASPRS